MPPYILDKPYLIHAFANVLNLWEMQYSDGNHIREYQKHNRSTFVITDNEKVTEYHQDAIAGSIEEIEIRINDLNLLINSLIKIQKSETERRGELLKTCKHRFADDSSAMQTGLIKETCSICGLSRFKDPILNKCFTNTDNNQPKTKEQIYVTIQ
jgi:hypothetical protein